MFDKLFHKREKKAEIKINYGRPIDPDTTGMDAVVTKKNLFPYCAEAMIHYSDEAGLCDCCGRKVDKYIISEPHWEGWEQYRKQLVSAGTVLATDSSKNFELHLCTECISEGKASQKFSIRYFNLPVHASDEWEIKGYNEVRFRTPDHVGCTGGKSKIIPCHCNEACELVGKCEGGKKIPEEMQRSILPFSDSVMKAYETEDFEVMHENAKVTFIFKCKQCGQHMALFY